MSNSVFLFVTGLTVGILLSMGLFNRYRMPEIITTIDKTPMQYAVVNEWKPPKGSAADTGGEDAVPPMDAEEPKRPVADARPPQAAATAASSSSSSKRGAAAAVQPASSFWVPGREGSYIKSVKAGATAVATGLESGMDKITDFFSGPASSSSSSSAESSSSTTVGTVVAGGQSGATAALLMVQGGEDEASAQGGGAASGGEDEGALMPGKGKKRRGKGRGKRGGKGRGEGRDDTVPQTVGAASGPARPASRDARASSHNTESSASGGARSSAGDDVAVQSLFFDEFGERVDAFGPGKTAKKATAGSALYTSPPLVPYHSQAFTRALDPPYVPSLPSVLAQRAAMQGEGGGSGRGRYSFPGGAPKALPNMTLQKAAYEKENLKLHLCNGVFEVRSLARLEVLSLSPQRPSHPGTPIPPCTTTGARIGPPGSPSARRVPL